MITYSPRLAVQNAKAELLVNTVNTVGVMGKGLALDMKTRFPEILEPYERACRERRLAPGTFQLVKTDDGRQVMNLATKQEWRDPSRYDWVGVGLVYMNRFLVDGGRDIRSVAMSMPGCGNGGLDAARVQHMMRIYLARSLEAGIEIELAHDELAAIDDPLFFAGVGSRETPAAIQALMTEIGGLLTEDGMRLRSGGAIGADTAFWTGARAANPEGMEIFLPKPKRHIPEGIVKMSPVFERLALNFHPHPDGIRPNPKNPDDKRHYFLKLMARNGNQIFGEDFRVPSSVVVCWTPKGEAGGGTGQAIRLATSVGIPVIDLGRPDLAGISATEVRDMARERVAVFRQSRGLPRLDRESVPVPV
ncbi:hypothetical protein OCH239_10925 [Roseivivax halodurans JCM 10272]|uniref:Macro domain-containing protein n=1 Tax=Roseivivax halodurans JCM 10272 TaxID=1449350 RepID=X7EDZ3_9RHOB|nr:macro domain-containing protein [Roseivivax halodurans]ETX13348.1 hypothetical protein OCH239_10925 [Roseivivax halodurans JCM 10272]